MVTQKKWMKIMAFLALFWITVWILWTWVLVILSWNNTNNSKEQKLSPEQYAQLQQMLESQSWTSINTQAEKTIDTLTWTTK